MNPLGEFGQMLPGLARRLAATPVVYRPLLALEQRLTGRSEERAPADFDATILVNPTETEELTRRSGSSTVRTLLPLLREPARAERRFDGSPTFVFLGGLDFPPNRDGLTWFLRECRQPVLAALPDFRLLVIGRATHDLPPEADAWQGRVQPLGWVDDLDGRLATAAGLISPLRIGSGIKIKVLEALARGLPVVATPHGVLGLDVGPDDGCLVADEPEGLAGLLARAADPVENAALSAGCVRVLATDVRSGRSRAGVRRGARSGNSAAGGHRVSPVWLLAAGLIAVAVAALALVRPRVALLLLVVFDVANLNGVIADQVGVSPYRAQLALATVALLIVLVRLSVAAVLVTGAARRGRAVRRVRRQPGRRRQPAGVLRPVGQPAP